MTRLVSLLKVSVEGIWFRTLAFTLSGIVLAVGAGLLSVLVPDTMQLNLGQGAVGSILNIIASSMLAVTTFSLTVMVSAYSSAMSSGTPRSTQLLLRDHTSQNALSTFVGAFAFSIVGIVALSLNIYSDTGRTLLFLGTLVVIAFVLIVLLNWISFLTKFGRMSDILDRTEKAAHQAVSSYAKDPYLGGVPWLTPPDGVTEITPDQQGFIVWIDMPALQRIATEADTHIWVLRRAGSRTGSSEAIAYILGEHDEELANAVQRAFVIEKHRTYRQDPRLSVIVLSEISSRALSPSVNDPGTSIEVLGVLERVLIHLVGGYDDAEISYDRVYVNTISAEDFIDDGFRPTARDGAAMLEVAMRVQTELMRLMRSADSYWNEALMNAANQAYERARNTLIHKKDIDEIESLHREAIIVSANRREALMFSAEEGDQKNSQS